MFSAYQALPRQKAAAIMNAVPVEQRTQTWHRLLDAMLIASENAPPSRTDEEDEKVTTRMTMILARQGHGHFRDSLMEKWQGRCAVTGLTCAELLRASHIQPWKSSSARQRLDPNNGLLLTAHIDALFDKGLIAFDDQGNMLLSSRIKKAECAQLNLPTSLRHPPSDATKAYLKYHREFIFDGK